jgi:hypothetical protein
MDGYDAQINLSQEIREQGEILRRLSPIEKRF